MSAKEITDGRTNVLDATDPIDYFDPLGFSKGDDTYFTNPRDAEI